MADTMGRGRPGVADEGQGVATTGHIGVVLAGNPNSGKTSLFNFLTGSNQKVGNWGGVTVEKKEGSVEVDGVTLNFLDLPGTYSLSPYSIEEVISRNYITDEAPDIVVNVIDASNVERNLYMTAQLLELGVPVIIALNMIDVAEGRGTRINSELLSQLLGVPVVGTVGRKGQGIEELKRTVLKVANGELPILRHSQITYGKELEQAISSLEALVVSQFTLYGDTRKGRRPGFTDAAPQEEAEATYERFVETLRELGLSVETGVFGAHMQVHIQNDGPVTLLVESP